MAQTSGDSLIGYFKKSLHKLATDNDNMFCQNPRCSQGEAVPAIKVCHDCASRPLLLCVVCDRKAHNDLRSRGHLRFDLPSAMRPAGVAGLAVGGSGTVMPSHSRSVSLPDRRSSVPAAASAAMFDQPGALAGTRSASRTESTAEEEELDFSGEEGDDNVMLDTGDGYYQRVAGGAMRHIPEDKTSAAAVMPQPIAVAAPRKRHTVKDRLLQLAASGSSASPSDDMLAFGRSKSLSAADLMARPQIASEESRMNAAWQQQVQAQQSLGSTDDPEVLLLQRKLLFSKEYYSVRFEVTKEIEMVQLPASKGMTLRDALEPLLQRRQLSTDQIEVYLDSSSTALSLHFDTFHLGGASIRITGKDDMSKRASNGSSSVAADKNNQSRTSELRSNGEAVFRKSSSASMLKSSTAAIVGGLAVAASSLPGRASFAAAGARRGTIGRDNKAAEVVSTGGISKLLHLSEDYHADDVAEIAGSNSGTASGASRTIKKALTNTPAATTSLAVNDEAHPDVSPSGTISKSWRGGSSNSRLTALLPIQYKDKDKAERLAARLDEWSRIGLPEMPPLYAMTLPRYDPRLFEIEEHWTSFIDKTELTPKQKEQQEALWELLYTEVEYIRSLNVVHDLFMCCIFNLQIEQLLNDVTVEQLFANITDIIRLNSEFWETLMLPVLEHSRQNGCLLNPRLLKSAFFKFNERFQPYTKYCLEHGPCSDYMKKMDKENDLFKTFVVWAEAQKQCNRLKLHDLLVKPMQRITRYSLLLRAVAKKTEDDETKLDLADMIQGVDKFVKHVDQTLRQKHEEEKLQNMALRIESYDAVDMPYGDADSAKVLASYSVLNIKAPMPGCGGQLRHLLHEGGLKMKDASGKYDVYCFLFTDLLLVTKLTKRADKVKVIKAPIRVDRSVVEELGKDSNAHFLLVHLSEYGVAQAAYAFHGENIAKWTNMIRKAQDMYAQAKEEAQDVATPTLQSHFCPSVTIEDDDSGFAGPELHRVSSSGSNMDALTLSSLEQQTPQLDSDDGGGSVTPTRGRHHSPPSGVRQRSASCASGGSSDGGDDDPLPVVAPASAAFSATVSRSASSPVMSPRAKSRTLPAAFRSTQQASSAPSTATSSRTNSSSSLQLTGSGTPEDSPLTRRRFEKGVNEYSAILSPPTAVYRSVALTALHGGATKVQGQPFEEIKDKGSHRRRPGYEKRFRTVDTIQSVYTTGMLTAATGHAEAAKRHFWNLSAATDSGDCGVSQSHWHDSRQAANGVDVVDARSAQLSPDEGVSGDSEDEFNNGDAALNFDVPRTPNMVQAENFSYDVAPHPYLHMDSKDLRLLQTEADERSFSPTDSHALHWHPHQERPQPERMMAAEVTPVPRCDLTEVRDVTSAETLAVSRQTSSRKLSHAELMRMRNQMFLNAAVDAAEV